MDFWDVDVDVGEEYGRWLLYYMNQKYDHIISKYFQDGIWVVGARLTSIFCHLGAEATLV